MHATSTTIASGNPTFLLLGDSLVANYDWQRRMPNFTIRNCGFPGATAHNLLQAIPALKSHFTSAKLVMIAVGADDIKMKQLNFLKDLTQIIIFLTQNYSKAELLVNSPLPIQLPELKADAIQSINREIEAICRRTGSCYIDIYKRFLDAKESEILWSNDQVQITEAGYELWTRTILEHIAFLLEGD